MNFQVLNSLMKMTKGFAHRQIMESIDKGEVGWSAHRIEEIICMNKIIRPAYMSVMKEKELQV